jgi:hypothetical protein
MRMHCGNWACREARYLHGEIQVRESELRDLLDEEERDAKHIYCDSSYMCGVYDGKLGVIRKVLRVLDEEDAIS